MTEPLFLALCPTNGCTIEPQLKRSGRCANSPGPGQHPLEVLTMAKRTCSVESCERAHYGLGLCHMHYQRERARKLAAARPSKPVKPTPLCSIDGCERAVDSRGWCILHYSRWQRHGDPCKVLVEQYLTMEDRFWAKVDKNGPVPEHRPDLGPCWLWTASKDANGYGQFNIGRTMAKAHAVAFQWLRGSVPPGLVRDHLCNVRHCCNPFHIQVTTHRVNILRGEGMSARHLRQTHCKHGHEFTPENTYNPPRKPWVRQCRTCIRARSRRAAPQVEVEGEVA